MTHGRGLVATTAVCVIVLLAALLDGCKPKKSASSGDEAASEKKPELIEALEAALGGCRVTRAGQVRKCEPPALLKRLEELEGKNLEQTARLYCEAQKDKSAKLRLAAAFRLDTVHSRSRGWANSKIVDCLVEALEGAALEAQQRLLGRTAGYMAPRVGRVMKLLKAVKKKPEAKRAVFDVLWAHGRLRVVHLIVGEMKSSGKDRVLREVIVRSFERGPPWNGRETEAVCGLLKRWLVHPDREVRRRALEMTTRRCLDLQGSAVVESARVHLEKKSASRALVEALGAVAGRSTAEPAAAKTSPRRSKTALKKAAARRAADRRAALELLERIVEADTLKPAVRAVALHTLGAADNKRAATLARRIDRDKSTKRALRRAASQILGKKPGKKPARTPTTKRGD